MAVDTCVAGLKSPWKDKNEPYLKYTKSLDPPPSHTLILRCTLPLTAAQTIHMSRHQALLEIGKVKLLLWKVCSLPTAKSMLSLLPPPRLPGKHCRSDCLPKHNWRLFLERESWHMKTLGSRQRSQRRLWWGQQTYPTPEKSIAHPPPRSSG